MPVVGGHAGITILPLFSQVLNLFCVHFFVKPSVYIYFDYSLCFMSICFNANRLHHKQTICLMKYL